VSDLIKRLENEFGYKFSVRELTDGTIQIGTSLHALNRVEKVMLQHAEPFDVLAKEIKQRLVFDLYSAVCDFFVEVDMSDPREYEKRLHEEIRQLRIQSRA
jgi:hypothetical protein